MAAKLTILAHKITIQLPLVAEGCTICSSRSRRPVRKLLVTSSYIVVNYVRASPEYTRCLDMVPATPTTITLRSSFVFLFCYSQNSLICLYYILCKCLHLAPNSNVIRFFILKCNETCQLNT